REDVRPDAESLRGDRGDPVRARPAAAICPRLLREVPGPCDVRQGLVCARGIPLLLADVRDCRRILRLLPRLSRVLEAQWPGPSRPSAAQGLLRERTQADARAAARGVSEVACRSSMIRFLAALIGCTAMLLVHADAQVRPIYDTGAAGLVQLLQRLQTTASVLHTGAHPDDEDSAFLARAARGDHARVAYLSLNRGEGGQNIIGSELFDALGVIRTEELLQARRLDGGEQFFTRTFDFGFSKRCDEAAAKWNEHDVLGDMVRVIRMFRPLVMYSRWGGTPADGHGHHQLAGYLSPIAFKAAADPSEFPEQLQEGLR